MSRFFISPESIQGDTAFIVGKEAHHIIDVLRLKAREQIQVFDGTGGLYRGEILEIINRKVKIQLQRLPQDLPAPDLETALIQALPKKNKMDLIVEKSTESGVDMIVPTLTARSIVKLDAAKATARRIRWQRIAQEASKQCGRITVPQVKDLAPWPDVLSLVADFELKLLFSVSARTKRLKDVLRKHSSCRRIALVIGPEGDFAPLEIAQAIDAGWVAVSLGSNVLKCDTAAIFALAMVNYELGQ